MIQVKIGKLIEFVSPQRGTRKSVRFGADLRHTYYRDDVDIDMDKVLKYLNEQEGKHGTTN
jgi:hypothetical protein